MNNQVRVQVCAFQDYLPKGRKAVQTYGYLIHDAYNQAWDNSANSIEDLRGLLLPENILAWVKERHPEFLRTVLARNGLYLNNEWVDVWEQMDDEQRERYNYIGR